MPMVIVNAFSVNMLTVPPEHEVPVTFDRQDPDDIVAAAKEAAEDGNLISAVGHADTAALLSDMLGVQIRPARIDIKLGHNEAAGEYKVVWLAQYKGPRLPEGAKTLPEGATIEWYVVSIGQTIHWTNRY